MNESAVAEFVQPAESAPENAKTKKPRKARRGRGEGAIFKRADGLWGCAISMGVNGDGKRRRKVVTGKTKDDVQRELLKLQQKAPLPNDVDPGKMTVLQYLYSWLETDAGNRCREGSPANHKRAVNNEIAPVLGRIPLAKLTALHVQSMLAEMADRGKSPFTRNATRKTLNRALNRAVRVGLLPLNPCSRVDTAREPRRALTVLSPEEVGKFFAVFSARRQVKLPRMAVEALKGHHAAMAVEGPCSQIVFCDHLGGPLRHSNVVRRSFKPLLKAAGLALMRFHDMRHSHASLLLLQGENPKVVQERLGHAKIELTLGTYSHLLPGLQRAAADRLDTFLSTKTSFPSLDRSSATCGSLPSDPPHELEGASR